MDKPGEERHLPLSAWLVNLEEGARHFRRIVGEAMSIKQEQDAAWTWWRRYSPLRPSGSRPPGTAFACLDRLQRLARRSSALADWLRVQRLAIAGPSELNYGRLRHLSRAFRLRGSPDDWHTRFAAAKPRRPGLRWGVDLSELAGSPGRRHSPAGSRRPAATTSRPGHSTRGRGSNADRRRGTQGDASAFTGLLPGHGRGIAAPPGEATAWNFTLAPAILPGLVF